MHLPDKFEVAQSHPKLPLLAQSGRFFNCVVLRNTSLIGNLTPYLFRSDYECNIDF